MATDPYVELVDVIQGFMSSHSNRAVSEVGGVLGTITSSGLKLDDFKYEFKDYLIAELPGTLTVPFLNGVVSNNLERTTMSGTDLLRNEIDSAELKLSKGLKVGDRVLAIRIQNGNEVVVICKVVRMSE